jgi:hypothetical protein
VPHDPAHRQRRVLPGWWETGSSGELYGSAGTLADVVEFYNQRFEIGFTDQQKADLVPFLSSL